MYINMYVYILYTIYAEGHRNGFRSVWSILVHKIYYNNFLRQYNIIIIRIYYIIAAATAQLTVVNDRRLTRRKFYYCPGRYLL